MSSFVLAHGAIRLRVSCRVIVKDTFVGDKVCKVRIDDEIFTSYWDALESCKEKNAPLINALISDSVSRGKKNVYKVCKLDESVPPGCERCGRSAAMLLNLPNVDVKLLNWQELLDGGGYLALRNSDLCELDVDPGLRDICRAAEGRVLQLGLSTNRLGAIGAFALKDMILVESSSCRNICGLYLSDNNIGNAGMVAIAQVVDSRVIPLVKLGLNSNAITDEGVRSLASVLRCQGESCLLEVLGLSRNLITDEGAESLADMLSNNSSLKRLFLNYNPLVGDSGGKTIAEAARHHNSLQRLGVAFCGLESESGLLLMNLMSSNEETIERICVSGNLFGESVEAQMRETPKFNFEPIK